MIEEWIVGLLIVVANKILSRWPNKVKSHRLAQLEKLLSDPKYPGGRSLEELQRKTGTTPTECRELLSELGAEGITLRNRKEGWRLSN